MRIALVLLAACGSGPPPSVTTSGPPASSIAVPLPGDVQVASVEGRPVWGSCVVAQIKRFPTLTKEIAVQQCIDLEMLAQTAERKGLAMHSEVIDATRTALVRRLVDQFAARFPDPESMKVQIDKVYQKAGTTFRPEIRGSWHAIAKASKDAPEAVHLAARQTAEQLYQRLKDETGLFSWQLENARDAVVALQQPANVELVIEELVTTKDDLKWAAEFRGALFGIPEVGRVSPVVKTDYGYHVILLSDLKPAAPIERAQVFAGLRRQQFVQYVGELTSQSRIEEDPGQLAPEGTP